ncbi:MAG: putative reverse transcriptase [Streblomastix strix]|uniref:Putative reverse transcriptase n=1 Tax=Streblomastix strix TaxID=222440 RepID=A0A5J4WD04_9EUKA|nr:MAG: putative reverse transcriptase [Streblomastix strix]
MQIHNAVLRMRKIEDNDQVFKEQKVALNLVDIPESSRQDELLPNRLLNRIDKWQQINADYWIEMGARPAWTSKYIGESKFQEELDQELKLGVVRQAKDEEILHWNPSYTVPKAGGKRRKILDCRELNAATKPAHFQMENINTVMQLIQKGDYSTHLDMEKAYHHVRVSQELQKYFGFHFRGKAYTYVGLPFGWNRSPMVFCRIMKQAVRAIRERWKVRVIQYIDDILLLSQDKIQLQTDTLEIMKFMEQLGWKIQRLKCRTNAQKTFEFLGWKWSTMNLTIQLTAVRRRQLKHRLSRWIEIVKRGERVKIKDLASVIGELNFVRTQLVDASLHMRTLYRIQTQAVFRSTWKGRCRMDRRSLGDLTWWLEKIKENQPMCFEKTQPSFVLTTDASETSWGAVLELATMEEEPIYRTEEWGKQWILKSSNQREMTAILMALRSLRDFIPKGSCILVRTDNTVTEFCIRKWKAKQDLLQIVRRIRKHVLENNLKLEMVHIQGFKNVIADSLSRIAANGDYYVKQKVLDQALAILGLPVWLDIFASRTNKRLRSYCNLLPDHQAYAVNGYSFNWSQINPYLHPPISQILKVLRKVRDDNAEAVLVIPSWKGQVWSRWIEEMKIAEVDLGESNECLEMGKLMKDLHQQLPPGRMKAVRLTSMHLENSYSGKWANALDQKMKL